MKKYYFDSLIDNINKRKSTIAMYERYRICVNIQEIIDESFNFLGTQYIYYNYFMKNIDCENNDEWLENYSCMNDYTKILSY